MTNDHNAWNWFDEGHANSSPSTVMPQELEKAFARLLAYPEAESVLTHLHVITRNRVFGPDASEAMLRHFEGQKALIAYIERTAAKGRGGQNSPT